ncbi:MAG: carboxypeptidase regulatory-like domain-containing protein [Acidobacteriaceae bacterium]|nr:carboxypeptidase regulatory-like domain-containing protein [Acidobacteriaceae bacterium]
MTRGQTAALAAATALFAAILLGVLLTTRRPYGTQRIALEGAVIRQDIDPRGRMPIAGAEITATSGQATERVKSDASGSFQLTLNDHGQRETQGITLRFRHPDYKPLQVSLAATTQIYVAHMMPVSPEERIQPSATEVAISNVRVRYSMKTTTRVSVGSLAKTFAVFNSGGVPCRGDFPCSPDGKWKATSQSASFDAGEGNEFREVRVSCIAGPCPFTKVSTEGPQDGRMLKVVALNWSNTATFLVEAEVTHTMVSDLIRHSIPVRFEDAMNFTLPPTGEGPSVEAEVNGAEIVFPLGPEALLPWAACNVTIDADRSKLFHCELKPGYRFQ